MVSPRKATQNASKIEPKTFKNGGLEGVRRGSGAVLGAVLGHLGSKLVLEGVLANFGRPREGQDGAKMGPRGAKMGQVGAKMGLRWPS